MAFAAVRRRAQRVQTRAGLGAEQADHEDRLVHCAGARLCQGQSVCRVQCRNESHGMSSSIFISFLGAFVEKCSTVMSATS